VSLSVIKAHGLDYNIYVSFVLLLRALKLIPETCKLVL